MDTENSQIAAEPPACPHDGQRIGHGRFLRKSDGKMVRRFKCVSCCRTFSEATTEPEVAQKKRHFNDTIFALFCCGVSLRRLSLILNLHRTTITRKLKFLGIQSKLRQQIYLQRFEASPIDIAQFDEMETHEHTKLKPLSIALAVCEKSRKILGFKVSSMPAKGHLAKKSIEKYGRRHDGRGEAMKALFEEIAPYLKPTARITSDENPKYPGWLKGHPWIHSTVKGRRGCISGQGELKKIGFDPLFSLNHTCAMIRANINRLFRRTWCTTKKIEALTHHLYLYMDFHNRILTNKK